MISITGCGHAAEVIKNLRSGAVFVWKTVSVFIALASHIKGYDEEGLAFYVYRESAVAASR